MPLGDSRKRTPAGQAGDSPFSFGGSAAAPGQEDAAASAKGTPAGSSAVPGQSSASGENRQDVVNEKSFGFGKKKGDEAGSLFAAPEEGGQQGPEYGYRKRVFDRGDEVSVYTAQMNARYAMDSRKRTMLVLLVLAVVLVPLFVVLPGSWLSGNEMAKGVAGWSEHLGGRINALGLWLSGDPNGIPMGIVFWQTATVAVVGAVLALNGAVYQGALKNALASPSTLGVISGGTLGSVVYTLMFAVPASEEMVTYVFASDLAAQLDAMSPLQYFFATQGRVLFSLAGCLVVVGMVLLISYLAGGGRVSKVALIIAGQVFTALGTGVVSVIRYYIAYNGTEQQLYALQNIMGGNVQNVMSGFDFALIAVPSAIGIAIILALRFKLNLLVFDDTEARSLGIKTNRTRNVMVIVCTVLTAVVVSFCGSVGFVGFLIPHLARKLVGPDFRYLIPTSAALGAVFLLVVNYIMNLGDFFSGSLGTFTSIIGAVFFLVVAVRQRARGNVDWI